MRCYCKIINSNSASCRATTPPIIVDYFPQYAHQEAHEVESEHGGHSSERQALQHGAADPSRVAVIFGVVVAAGLAHTGRAPKYPHHHEQTRGFTAASCY